MIKGNPVSAYLIYSFLYDVLCADLLARFDDIRHPHKHLLDKDALRAGSAYHLATHQYPAVVREIALNLKDDPLYLDKLDLKWANRSAPEMSVSAKPPASRQLKSPVQGSLLDL